MEGGRGLLSIADCEETEEQSFSIFRSVRRKIIQAFWEWEDIATIWRTCIYNWETQKRTKAQAMEKETGSMENL